MSAEPDQIPQIIKEYEDETKAFEESLVRICWYMRGWDLESAYNSTPKMRKAALKLIEQNIENTNKSGIALV